jgi:hypothetical protein
MLDFGVMQNTDRYHDGDAKVVSVIANESVAPKQETNMSKKLKLAVLAAVLAIIGAISSPVLAAGYDDPAFTGGGSAGYNAHIGDS